MVKVERSTVIDAPVDRVWSVLRDFNGHDRWHPAVKESRIEERRPSDAIGAVRRFRLTDGATLRERLLTLSDSREDLHVLPAGYSDPAAQLRRPRRAAPGDRRRAHLLALVVGVRHPRRSGAQAPHPRRRGHLHARVHRNPQAPRGVSGPSGPEEPMTHDVRRSEFTSLVDPDAPVRQIGTGFIFTEGPLWHPTEHYLLFSDMPGDVRRRWDEAGGVREVMRPANKCNGMTYDADLNLVICEHATSSLVRLAPDGRREVLASPLRGQGAQQPERRLRALRRHHLLLRPVVRADAALRRRAPARARMAGGVPRVAGRASSTSPSTSASSTSRTGCASRPTRAGSTSTTPPGR